MILQDVHRARLSITLACVAPMTGCLVDLHEGEHDDHGHFTVALDLDLTAECGGSQKLFPLALYNNSTKDVEISAASPPAGFSVIDPLPMVLAANQTGAVTVRAPAVVVGTDLAGSAKGGQLVLSTSEGEFTTDLSSITNGANLEITDAADKPLALAFSGAGCPAPITAKITNWGNQGMVWSAPTPAGFRIEGFTSGTIGPNETKMITIRPYTTSACTGTEAISFTGAGAMCTTPVVVQASFSLTGTPTCSCP